MVSAKRYKSNFLLECVNESRSNASSIDKIYDPDICENTRRNVQNERYVNKISRRSLILFKADSVTEMRWDFTANHICYIDCSEAFYNNNTYNWTTFWPFKTFAIILTYYYSNAITHLNALLLRSIVRTRHYKFIFLSSPIVLTHRVVLLYIIQHRQGNISECITRFWWASDISWINFNQVCILLQI